MNALHFHHTDPRSKVRQSAIDRYRTPPTPDAPHGSPAPDWAWKAVDAVMRHAHTFPDLGAGYVARVLAWCERGDHELRSAMLCAAERLWLGDRAPFFDAYLRNVEAKNIGPTKSPARVYGTLLEIMKNGARVKIDGHASDRILTIQQIAGMPGCGRLFRDDRVRIVGHHEPDPGESKGCRRCRSGISS